MSATVGLRWGNRELPFTVSAGDVVQATNDPSARLDPESCARDVARRLEDFERPVLIVVPDRTRAFPLSTVLPAVVDELVARGLDPARVTVAIASGSHVPGDADVAPAHLGRLPTAVRIVRHDPDGPVDPVRNHRTRAGTPMQVAPILLEAPRVIALGGTGFHYFAGFGGGGKLLFPGLGGRAAIAANHQLSLGPLPPGGLAPGVEPGRVAGNPVAEDLAEIHYELVSPRLLTLWRNDGGWSGGVTEDPFEFRALCERFAAPRRAGPAGAAALVVASCGGAPKDIDVVQSHKALFHASRFAREDAEIVFLAACAEGIGSPSLARWLARPGRAALEADARAAYELNAQTAISLAAIAARTRVTWVAREPLPLLSAWGIEVVTDPVAALARVSGRGALILPDATDVLPL